MSADIETTTPATGPEPEPGPASAEIEIDQDRRAQAGAEVERYVPQLPSDAASLSYEDLVELGRQVVHAAQWAFGDLACAVETGYGESRLQEFAADIGLRYETLLLPHRGPGLPAKFTTS